MKKTATVTRGEGAEGEGRQVRPAGEPRTGSPWGGPQGATAGSGAGERRHGRFGKRIWQPQRGEAGREKQARPPTHAPASGALSVIAGVFIFIVVIWIYHAVMNEEGIRFPPTFHMPFRPERQEIGSTVPVAVLAAILMLLSGLFTLSYQLLPRQPSVPEASEV